MSFLILSSSLLIGKTFMIVYILSPPSRWQKSFATFGLGSSSQLLVANWKKYPHECHSLLTWNAATYCVKRACVKFTRLKPLKQGEFIKHCWPKTEEPSSTFPGRFTCQFWWENWIWWNVTAAFCKFWIHQ